MIATLRGRLAAEGGFTLIELISALAILAVVLSGIVAMFVAGMHSEADMNVRFQAQENARLALSSMGQDIRTACGATTPLVPAAPTATQVTFGYCGDATGWHTTPVSYTTWCIRAYGGHYALFRQGGTSCSAGIMKADWLTASAAFAYIPAAGALPHPQLRVTLPVDADPTKSGGLYTLGDTIMLRNAA
jgi:prepilin-type N-terminal cleavage/methylation domain-containing protein